MSRPRPASTTGAIRQGPEVPDHLLRNNGPFTEDGNRYEGTVGEGVLTFEGPARFQYALDDQGRIALNADGTISVAWWLTDETGEWQPWMTNTFTKVR